MRSATSLLFLIITFFIEYRSVGLEFYGVRPRISFLAQKALHYRGSGGMVPQENWKSRVWEMPFPTISEGQFNK